MPEVFRILRAQEGALMVIKPPGDVRVGRVLKIDNRIYIAIEKRVFKQLVRPVGQACVREFTVGRDPAFQKTRDVGCRGCAIETMIVIEDPNLHLRRLFSENLLDCLTARRKASDKR
jgi:hypothetical protein